MVVMWWCCGGVVYLIDYRTTPGCLTLFYSVQLWIVAIIVKVHKHQTNKSQRTLTFVELTLSLDCFYINPPQSSAFLFLCLKFAVMYSAVQRSASQGPECSDGYSRVELVREESSHELEPHQVTE